MKPCRLLFSEVFVKLVADAHTMLVAVELTEGALHALSFLPLPATFLLHLMQGYLLLNHCLLHDQISTRFILTVKFNTGRPQGLVYIFWALSTSGISQLSTGLVLKYSQTKLSKV